MHSTHLVEVLHEFASTVQSLAHFLKCSHLSLYLSCAHTRSESHLTTLNDKSELLASCVLCAGSLYGGDGGLFHSMQRDAWMCDAPLACVDSANG
jgi:hypothetical protein